MTFPSTRSFTCALLCLWIAAGVVSLDSACADDSATDKILKTIREKGYKRVAVLPKVVARNAGDGNRVTGTNTVGALSMAWPDELYDALLEASLESNGEFVVVTDQQVLQALKGKGVDDVGTEEMWDVIRDKTGADYLASIDVTDPGPDPGKTGAAEVKRVVNGVDLKTQSAATRVTQKYTKTLSDAAYAGESFVVREWDGDELLPTGLSGGDAFAVGLAAEAEQYANLLPQEHPLFREDYPYGFTIEVEGEQRVPHVIDGQLVVELNEGEEYAIRIWNRAETPIFAGLYVDGVNTIGGDIEMPDLTPTHRTWYLKPTAKSYVIKGWTEIDPATKKSVFHKFLIVDEDDSVAAEAAQAGGTGFADNLGMITLVAYTYGMENVPKTKTRARALRRDTLGTGRGERSEGGVGGFDPNKKQKGLMLSTMTMHYRSSQWFEENYREDEDSTLAVVPKPAPDVTNQNGSGEEELEAPPKADDPADSENDLPE